METVVEVLPELAPADRRLEVAVRRRHHAHVGLLRAGGAQALELALLEDAEELGLHERAHLPDLVEEEHASRGLLEAAGLGRGGARERALLVAEELGLQELVGEGRAVEGHERAFGAGRPAVDEAGHDLLARSRLAGEEDGRLRGRDLRGLGEHVLPLPRASERAVGAVALQLLAQARDARGQAVRPLRRLHASPLLLGEPLVGEGEGHVVRDAAGESRFFLAVLLGLLAREHEEADDALLPGARARAARSGPPSPRSCCSGTGRAPSRSAGPPSTPGRCTRERPRMVPGSSSR